MMRPIVFVLTLALFSFQFAFGEDSRAANNTFRVKMFVSEGSNWKSRDVVLNFEQNRIVLSAPNDELHAVSMTYGEMKRAEYAQSQDYRKISPRVAIAANMFALPLMLRKTDNRWLTVHSDRSDIVVNLDNNNYESVVNAFEAHAGMRVSGWNVKTVAATN